MLDRQVIRIGAIVWAAVGASVSIAVLRAVNSDARLLVVSAAIVGCGAALMASHAIEHGHTRRAGWLLLLSVITPTFFAWVLNVPALVVGLMLVVAPQMVTDGSRLRGS